jgi:hypothetical protein
LLHVPISAASRAPRNTPDFRHALRREPVRRLRAVRWRIT